MVSDPYQDLRRRVQERMYEQLGVTPGETNIERSKRQIEAALGLPEGQADDRNALLTIFQDAFNEALIEQRVRLSEYEAERLFNVVMGEMVGLGPLEPLLHDPEVSAVHVLGTEAVYVERDGHMMPAGVAFDDEGQLNRVARRIFSDVSYLTGEGSGLASGHLPDGSRVDAVLTADVTPAGAQVVIRKQPDSPPALESLVDAGMLPLEVSNFLRASLLSRHNILIAGPPRGGKTTLLAGLVASLADETRLVVVERAREVPVKHENAVFLEAEVQLDAAYGTDALLRRAPEFLPDWVVLGDVTANVAGPYAELLARVNLCATLALRNPGGPSEVRVGAQQALDRLVAQASLSNPWLPSAMIEAQIALGLDRLVLMDSGPDGRPFVGEVVTVGRERGRWRFDRLYSAAEGSVEAVEAATRDLAAEAAVFVGHRSAPATALSPLTRPVFGLDGSLADMSLDEVHFVAGKRAIGLREEEGRPVSAEAMDAEDEIWRMAQAGGGTALVWSDTSPEGIRMALAHPPVSVGGIAASVDRFDAQPGGLRRLADLGIVTATAGPFLVKAARAGLSLLVCGPAGCGKRALMDGLLDYVDDADDWQVLGGMDRVTLPLWLDSAGEGHTMAGMDCTDHVDPLAALSAWSALWSREFQATSALALAGVCDVLIRMGRVGDRQRMILSVEEVISQSDGYRYGPLFAAGHDASQRLTLVEVGQPSFQYRLDEA